jgi:hypothetical protein
MVQYRFRRTRLWSNGLVGQAGFWLRFWTVAGLFGNLMADLVMGKGLAYLIRIFGFDYRFGWLALLPLAALLGMLVRPTWHWLTAAAVNTDQLEDGKAREYVLLVGVIPATFTATALALLTWLQAYRLLGMALAGLFLLLLLLLLAPSQVVRQQGRFRIKQYSTSPFAIGFSLVLAFMLVLGHWRAIPSAKLNGQQATTMGNFSPGSGKGLQSKFIEVK